MLSGRKTYIGGALIGLAAAIKYVFPDYAELADFLIRAGEMFGLIGLGHKMVKLKN